MPDTGTESKLPQVIRDFFAKPYAVFSDEWVDRGCVQAVANELTLALAFRMKHFGLASYEFETCKAEIEALGGSIKEVEELGPHWKSWVISKPTGTPNL
jgi:hypothetical protein